MDQNKNSGIVDAITAQALLDTYSNDNYKDSGFTAASMGYKYKFHIPVHSNRSVETISTLYDAENGVLLEFKTRQHGYRDDGSQAAWPDFGDGDVGLNQFSSGGNTVTGLVEVDLNSPEDNPQVYGPWPVNRIVRGLDGNALTCKSHWNSIFLASTSYLFTFIYYILYLYIIYYICIYIYIYIYAYSVAKYPRWSINTYW